MHEEKAIFENFLKNEGLKLTKPRQVILSAVFKLHCHFDADFLYDKIKNKYKDVSITTIYRTIPLLIKAGLVKKALRKNGKEFYEHVYGHPHHVHLICSKCGKIIEDDSGIIDDLINKLSEKYNFETSDYTINLKGICKDCK